MKKRKQRNPREEQHIAEEVNKATLRRQIARLKQLPNDFRDTYDIGKDWNDFMKLVPKRVKEMLAWSRGPVLCLCPLNEAEKRVWGEERRVILFDCGGMEPSLLILIDLLKSHDAKCSFIYLPMYDGRIIDALNILLSEWKYNIRARKLIRGSDGYPVGITH